MDLVLILNLSLCSFGRPLSRRLFFDLSHSGLRGSLLSFLLLAHLELGLPLQFLSQLLGSSSFFVGSLFCL
ncbi:hypothetical protein GGR55DRAFT_633814 [Xylaria sp. FL0064]|nr:hypothetical protein GGR55DRAFT_633814 [Xylaria sp. FL0064]